MSHHKTYHKSMTVGAARVCWDDKSVFLKVLNRTRAAWLCLAAGVLLNAPSAMGQEQPRPETPEETSATEAGNASEEAPRQTDRMEEILIEMAAETAKEKPDEAKLEALQKELESLLAAQTPPDPAPTASELAETSGATPERTDLDKQLEAVMQAWAAESEKDPESVKAKELEKQVDEILAKMEALAIKEAPEGGVLPVAPETVTPTEEAGMPPVPAQPQPAVLPQPQPQPETPVAAAEVSESGGTATPPVVNQALPPGPDDVIKLTLQNNMIDINYLLDLIGKEMRFIFLYDAVPPTTNVKIQQYGDLHRRDLLPLLEALLRFNGYGLVREDPFIRIVPLNQAQKITEINVDFGDDEKALAPGDMIVVQIIELQHTQVAQVQAVLSAFTTPQGVIMPVPTNQSMMIITEYARRMPRLLELIELLDQPGPPKRLEVTDVTYMLASEAATQLQNLIRDLGEYTATVAAPTASRRRPTGRSTRDRPVQPQPQPQQPQPQPIQAPAVVPDADAGPVIHVDERTNRLFIIGTDEQIQQTQQLLTLLDVKIKDPVLIRAFVMKEVVPSDIGQQILSLLEAIGEDAEDQVVPTEERPQPNQPQRTPRQPVTSRNSRYQQPQGALMQAGEGGPFLLGDDRTNRLIVVGKESQIEKIEELLELLDVPAAVITGAHIVVYTLMNVEAAEAEGILNDLQVTISTERPNARDRARGISNRGDRTMPGSTSGTVMTGEVQGLPTEEDFEVRTAIQESTNRLFVLATNKQHEQIANIIEKVDMEPPDDRGAIQVYFLENRKPEDVASMLEAMLESEQRDEKGQVNVPGKEGAPIVVPLEDIYAVAVRASAKQHDNIRQLVEILDKRLPQVLVEAILVQVNADEALDLGVTLQNVYDVGGTRNSGRNVSGQSPFSVGGVTIGASGIASGTGGTFAFMTDDLVYAAVEALQTEGKGKVVSMPRVLVNDNEAGSIDSKRQEPTTKTTIPGGSDTPIIEFAGYEDAGTTLTITPHISEGDFLKLEIQLQVDSFLGEGQGNVPPAKSTNQIDTIVTVPNDITIVLGGLTTENTGTSVNKIPILGDIPLIGALFRNVGYSQNKNVLYVFVKANIIRSEEDDQAAFDDMDQLSEKHREKLRELEKGYKNLPIIPGIDLKDKESHKSVLDEDY